MLARLYISLFLVFGYSLTNAQDIYSWKADMDIKNIEKTTFENDLWAVGDLGDSVLHLFKLEAKTTLDLGKIPFLETLQSGEETNLVVNDFKSINDTLYLLIGQKVSSTSEAASMFLTYAAGKWEIEEISYLLGVNKLVKIFNYNGQIHLFGVFGNNSFNLLRKTSSGQWEPLGNALVRDKRNDVIHDVLVFENNIYAAGLFSKPSSLDQVNLSIFDGESWSIVKFPPFINKGYKLHNWREKLVMYGSPNIKSDYFKYYDGSTWIEMQGGLDNVEIKDVFHMFNASGNLWVYGDFVSGNKSFNSLVWNDQKWTLKNIPLVGGRIKHIEQYEGSPLISGNFKTNSVSTLGVFSKDKLISGYIFNDENGNCILDSDELGVKNIPIQVSPNNYFVQSDEKGFYQLPVLEGNYTIKAITNGLWMQNCPEIEINTTTSNYSELKNIGIKAIKGVGDVKVNLVQENGWKIVRTGNNRYKFIISNPGNEKMDSAKFELEMPDWWEKIDFTPQPKNVAGKYVWQISDLQKDSSYCISFTGVIKPSLATLEGKMKYKTTVGGLVPDVINDNDDGESTYTITESLEPISKQISVEDMLNKSTTALGYHIGFRNISGSTIDKVIVRDTIDEDLYILSAVFNSFMPLTNEDVKVDLLDNGNHRYIYTWEFDNAGLADSASDVDKSSGFIQFDLNLAEGYLKDGIQICNQAKVNFDELEPMRTNRVCKTVGTVSVPKINSKEDLKIYPNPAFDKFTIENKSNDNIELDIYSSTGSLIRTLGINSFTDKTIQTDDWTTGIYYLSIQGYSMYKLVIY